MKDIENHQDIVTLLTSFYDKAAQDEVIGSKFDHLNMEEHIEVIANFWESILLGANNYKGDPFGKHIPLNLHKPDFDRWVQLFTETIDNAFAGPVADEAKLRGETISKIFQYKLDSLN